MSRRHDLIEAEFQDGWHSACHLHHLLAQGGQPRPVAASGMALDPGEECVGETELEYARWHGFGVHVTRPHPTPRRHLHAVGGRREPEPLSRPLWQDEQVVVTLLTTARLLCDADDGWRSFWYGRVTGQIVELARWSFQLRLADTDPVRLRGPDAPAYALAVAWFTHGEEVLWQPEFAPLADDAPMPAL